MAQQPDPREVKKLVKAVTKLGHEVRKDETSDTAKVKKAQKEFKEALAKASPEVRKAAWDRVGKPPKGK